MSEQPGRNVERSIPRYPEPGSLAETKYGAVYEQRRRLDLLLETLANTADQLERVIEPVLTSITKDSKRDEPRVMAACPLARDLADRCDVLEAQVERLNEIIARVSI